MADPAADQKQGPAQAAKGADNSAETAENVTRIETEPPADDAPTTPTEPITARSRPRRKFRHHLGFFRPILRLLLMVVVPVVAAGYGALWWGESMRYVTTENAYIKADVVAISADVSGRVIEIEAHENTRVTAGQLLFRIDPRPFEIAIFQAKAELDRVRTEIESTRADYRSGQREVRVRQERVRYLEGEYARQQQLTKRGHGTGAKLDEARHELEMAKREVDAVGQRNRMLLAELVGDAAIKVADHPKHLAALAELDRAELDFSYTTVVAPADGIVSNIKLQHGEYVRSGEPMFSLVQVDAPWIEANLKETQLTHVRIAQQVSFVVDSYPDLEWRGKVASIAPATGAEFSLLPPQNASGNWVKVVQRIPVRIAITKIGGDRALRAGMTVTLAIDTERDRSLGVMVREMLAWLGLENVVPESWLVRLDD